MNIFDYFYQSFKKISHHPALVMDGSVSYTYEQLYSRSSEITSAILKSDDNNLFVGLFTHRSITSYSGLLGILNSGKGYVPLSHKFPSSRNLTIIELSKINTIVLGKEILGNAIGLLESIHTKFNIIIDFDPSELPAHLLKKANLRFVSAREEKAAIPGMQRKDNEFAYLLFTSGSTGIPKGVPITHINVTSYVDYISKRYDPQTSDRFSQTFDLTFDLSVHDIFVCWASGATLYCIPEQSLMAPAKFIKVHNLTFWFSVPSMGLLMNRLKMLKPGIFPSLKVSLFCGEPLPVILAEKWQEAAPDSIVENIYGPTETTIGITHYRWNKGSSEKNRSLHDIVSIGKVFSTQHYRINPIQDDQFNEGELLLSGSQVTIGYWNNADKTNKQFISFPESPEVIWYKTGDIVKEDQDGYLYYQSRIDLQVKVRGHRIELEEINNTVKLFTKEDIVLSIPFPVIDEVAQGIYLFILNTCKFTEKEIIDHCKRNLPEYMVPDRVVYIDQFPLNVNGKVDRKQLEIYI